MLEFEVLKGSCRFLLESPAPETEMEWNVTIMRVVSGHNAKTKGFTGRVPHTTVKCILQAISCRFVAEHVTSAPQLLAATWDKAVERLQKIKQLPIANLARAAFDCAQDSITQGSCARNL